MNIFILFLYLMGAIVSAPLMMMVEYRHSRFTGSPLSKRQDAGLAMLIALPASSIWPIGWAMILLTTGFAEGFSSEEAKR